MDDDADLAEIELPPRRRVRLPPAIRPAKPLELRRVAGGAIVLSVIGGLAFWHPEQAAPEPASVTTAAAPMPTAIDPEPGALPARVARVPDPIEPSAPPPARIARPRPPPTHVDALVVEGRDPAIEALFAPPAAPPPAPAPTPTEPPSHLEGDDDGLVACMTSGDDRCIIDRLAHGRAHGITQLRLLFQAQRQLSDVTGACATARQLEALRIEDATRDALARFESAQCVDIAPTL